MHNVEMTEWYGAVVQLNKVVKMNKFNFVSFKKNPTYITTRIIIKLLATEPLFFVYNNKLKDLGFKQFVDNNLLVADYRFYLKKGLYHLCVQMAKTLKKFKEYERIQK